MLRRCGRGIVFGDVGSTRTWLADPRVEVHGPGYSKVVLGPDWAEDWPKYLDVMVSSIAENGGRSCVNASGVDFDVHTDASGGLTIRYALSAVKGVGEGQARALVAARGETPFRDLGDVARRLNPREVNKKVLESLAAAGAFDRMEADRARAFASIEPMLAIANHAQDERAAGQAALFGGGGDADRFTPPKAPAWPAGQPRRNP